MDVLFNPEKTAIEPLMKAAPDSGTNVGGVVYALTNQNHVRQCCKIVRDICTKRGIDFAMVPVIHRIKGRFRYWDVRQGEAGASNYCVLLCGSEWRVASADEQTKFNNDSVARRQEAFERQKREASAKVIAEAGIKQIIEASVRMPELAAQVDEKRGPGRPAKSLVEA